MYMANSIIDEISMRTGISALQLSELVNNCENEYKKVRVVVNGKKRTFFIPSTHLKLIHYYIIQLLFSGVSVSSNAHAYIKKKSIKTNVLSHIGNRYFYQTDISSFFPSVTESMIRLCFERRFGYLDKQNIDFLVKAVAPFGHLDLGSPTSPYVSNIVLVEFDMKLSEELSKLGSSIVYTRYSDDITISSKTELDRKVDLIVERLLNQFGFKKNDKKTKFSTLKDKIKITGLYLYNDGQLTVGTKYKKKIRHYLHLARENKERDFDNNQILGMLSFLRDIEPNYYQKLILKYSDDKDSIIDILKEKK